MKLGDNMATVEPCNMWGDVRPRKSRPPRIGDIPRHGAVDEESPGASSKKLTSSPSDPAESMLEISLGAAHAEDAFTTKTPSARRPAKFELEHNLRVCTKIDVKGASPSALMIADKGKLNKLPDTTRRQGDEIETADGLTLTLDALQGLSRISSDGRAIVGKSSDLDRTMKVESWEVEDVNAEVPSESENLEATAIVVVKRPSLTSRISESICNLIGLTSSPAQASRQVRKDSAVYLEEVEDLSVPRENSRPRSARCLTPRRESSGYASNLGTFDEDRRSFEVDLSSLRERRRSSTKRLTLDACQTRPVNRVEESLSICESTLSLDRMPTIEVHRKASSTGLDMPDIEEVKDTEIVQDTLLRAGSSARCEGVVETCPIVDQCGTKNVLVPFVRDDDVLKVNVDGTLYGSRRVPSGIDAVGTESLASDGIYVQGLTRRGSSSNTKESFGAQTLSSSFSSSSSSELSLENLGHSPSKAHQRKMSIVHQCSTPNFSSTELESIVERPSEKSPDKQKDSVTCGELQDRGRAMRREQQMEDERKCDELEDVRLEDEKAVGEPVEDSSVARVENNGHVGTDEILSKDQPDSMRFFPKSNKVYRLLSTQSEDRDDNVAHLTSRRISLQILRHEDEKLSASALKPDDKMLLHSDSVPTLNVPGYSDSGSQLLAPNMMGCSAVRKSSMFGEVGTTPRLAGDSGTVGIRPIYPYCPYSPYGSPQGSPGTRRRPLMESRRVSIDNKQGTLQLNQYKLLDNIGQGSFGIVKLVYNEEDETHYAMKILSKKKLMKKAGIFGRMAPGRKTVSSNPLAKVYREIALLKKLDHPNVVKLVEVLDDPDEDNLYLVFELVQRGEVLQVPTNKPLDENAARTNFRDIVMGVEYLHYQRIVHRDIKPSNLLVDGEGRVKVADLGVSAELRAAGELLSGSAGTPAFAAPETTTPGAQYSGTLCDVWSMGVTLYSLVTGRVPWDGAGSIIGVQAAIRSEPLKFPEKPKLSKDLCDLISRMLSKEPSERITLPEIKNHKWITENDTAPLPSEADNCRLPVTVTDEEVARVVTRVPKLDTLILIKTMLKQHSFQNPFLPRRNTRSTCSDSTAGELSSIETNEASGTPESGDSRTKQFHKTGRSNSAPDSYEWHASDRQVSIENPLPPVTEASNQEAEVDKR